MRPSILKVVFSIIVITLNSGYLSAQNFLFQELPKQNTQINFHFMRPTFNRNVDLSALSGIYDISVNVPLNESLNLIGSLPFLIMKSGDRDSESGLGNLFLAIQIHKSYKDYNGSIVTLGIAAPTADEEVGLLGLFTDFNGFHKYAPNTLTIFTNYAYHALLNEGIKLGVEVGPNIFIPTKGESEIEIFLNYGLTAGVQIENFAVFTELIGLAIITQSTDDFVDRFNHSFDIGAMYLGGSVSTGLYYKIYIEEMLSESITGVVGVKFSVSMN